jgi:arylsulfatase A-like enzyme
MHNILYLHSHDTGRHISPFGHAVHTPNLQHLAEQGVLFRRAFCISPSCSASRAALLTGQCSHNAGMLGLAHRGWGLTDPRQHLNYTLQAAGYHTVLTGIQHVAQDRQQVKYDQIFDATGDPTVNAIRFLESRPSKPFFLDVGYFLTHRNASRPGMPTFHNGATSPAGDPRYVQPLAPLPDHARTRQDTADFIASVEALDRAYGCVLNALDRAGLAQNTLVICTTDHGPAFPGMKCNLTDGGCGVLLILRGPGGLSGGRAVDAMVTHMDLYPTICELCGIAAPSWLQGKSLLPLVRGEASNLHEATFSEVTYHAAYEPMRAVRSERWKYIRRFDSRDRVTLPNTDDGVSKFHWMREGWADRLLPGESLHDLTFDPHEACNLAGDPRYAQPLEQMRTKLRQWMESTDDPLLRGPVPLAAGGRTDPVDDISPGGGTPQSYLSGW